MQKLKTFGRKIKGQLDKDLILNKDLIFTPTFKSNKQNFYIEMEFFFGLVKSKPILKINLMRNIHGGSCF